MTHRSFSARADIEAILASLEATRIDVPVIQPADPFLDTAGEELRRRIFLTEDENGTNMCLRPEFTIPVCRAHLQSGAPAGRYGYVGTVFRQRRAGGSEFLQAGIEDIGEADTFKADARAIADASNMLGALGVGHEGAQIVIGDQTVFDAMLSALGLPPGWRLTLAHDFGSRAALKATLERLATPPPMPMVPQDIADAVATQDPAKLEAAINAHLESAGLANSAGRSAAEIAARLSAKIADAQLVPDPATFDILRAFLAINEPLASATLALGNLAATHGLLLDDTLEDFVTRIKAMEDAGLDTSAIIYEASFGRRLDYYTGLVFEFRDANREVLVGGGRYDRLLPLLGADEAPPAIGFSVWLDRLGGAS